MWGSGVLTAVSQVPRHQRSQMFGTFTYTYTVRPATKFVTVTHVGRGAFPTRTNYGYYDYMGHSVRGLIFLGLFCPGHYVRGALCPVFGSAVIASIICVLCRACCLLPSATEKRMRQSVNLSFVYSCSGYAKVRNGSGPNFQPLLPGSS